MKDNTADRKATNYDVVKTLSQTEISKMMSDARCLACVFGDCADTEYKERCITGFQKWLNEESDIDNWNKIFAIIRSRDGV